MIKKIAVFLLFSQSLHAEIITDGSLGERVALTAPLYQITDTLGKTMGNNLFYSFEKFNLNQDEIATFSGTSQIENIIARVTGGTSSIFNGTLRSTFPHANLYFMNPNGVLFGQNVQLDLTGSAYFSTANVIKFTDSTQLTANLNQNNLLTVAAPTAFGFLTANSAPLLINNSQLHLEEQQVLSFSAGRLAIDGIHLNIPEGTVQLISVAAPSELNFQGQLSPVLENNSLNSSGDITLTNSTLQVTGNRGGSFILHGKNIQLNNSDLLARTIEQDGQNIDIQAENIKIAKSLISASTDGRGRSGTIQIKVTDNLLLSDGSQLAANTRVESADGDAGTLRIHAKTVRIMNGSGIQNATFSKGLGGKIEIDATDKVEIDHSYLRAMSLKLPPEITSVKDFDFNKIKATDAKFGNAGDIAITTDKFIATESLLTSSSITGGDAGTVSLKANNISLRNSIIASNTFSSGQAGRVTLAATQEANLERSLIFANSESTLPHAGNAGEVSLTTDRLSLNKGSQLSLTTFTDGNSGTVQVNANHAVFDGYSFDEEGKLYSSGLETATFSHGDAGKIQVVANQLELRGGAKIDSSTYGSGRAGKINLDITQSLDVSAELSESLTQEQYDNLGRGIISSSIGINSGNAGNLFIRTPRLIMTQNGRISTSAQQAQAGTITLEMAQGWLQQAEISSESEGDGNAGNIALIVADEINVINSKISTQAQHAAGGNISLQLNGQLLHLGQGAITTSVKGGMGGGGNITVIQPQFAILNNSQIIAQADGGNGGNISISSHHFITSPESLISASSQRGISGEVKINTPDSNNYCGPTNLPSEFFKTELQLKKRCHDDDSNITSSFVIKQQDGIPNMNDDLQDSFELATVQK